MKKTLLFLIMMVLGVGIAYSQTQITGVVTDADDGTTLPGVTVLAVGTSVGTTTDIDGNYSITVPAGTESLRFSYVGYQAEEILIGNQSTINVALKTSFTNLDEVIVIGYGTSTRESLTGAVEVVRSDVFEMTPLPAIEGTLQGNVAGLQMVAADGQPGAASQVRIRGVGSINASSEPLYVIDGMPVETGSFNYYNDNGGRSSNVMSVINPNDIETISILKDASATAIYGSRGANGVILITTKSGKKGKSRIEFNTSVGFSDVAYN
ncbi:MAG: carboxypeptidase-like regulatory domain-containing protein, partial [Bacteroidales bacterium]